MSTESYLSYLSPKVPAIMLICRPMAAPSLIDRCSLSRLLLLLLLMLSSFCMFAVDETGEPAPRFRAKTTSGSQFNNASVKGKVVLFEFWTSWCKYCEEEASLVDDIAREFSDRGLLVLAVDVLEPDQTVKKYLAEHPRSVPIVLTKDTNLAACTTRRVIPSMWWWTATGISQGNSGAPREKEGCEGC